LRACWVTQRLSGLAASTWAQHARVVEQLQQRFREAAELPADAAGDLPAFTAFPNNVRG